MIGQQKVLLSYYRQSSLELLICPVEQTTGNSDIVEHFPLGPDVQESKFKRFTTAADMYNLLEEGQPIPVLLYGSKRAWRAGVVGEQGW
jgi:hypothetical protein